MSIYNSPYLFSKAYGKRIHLKPTSKWNVDSQDVRLITQVRTFDTPPPKRKKRNVSKSVSAYGTIRSWSGHKPDEKKSHGDKSNFSSRDVEPLNPERGLKSVQKSTRQQLIPKERKDTVELDRKPTVTKTTVTKSSTVITDSGVSSKRANEKRSKKGVKVIRSARAVNPFETLARIIKIST